MAIIHIHPTLRTQQNRFKHVQVRMAARIAGITIAKRKRAGITIPSLPPQPPFGGNAA